MKVNNVKSFEYRTDLLGGIDKITSEVNNFIQNLKKKGTTEIELDITTTGRGIIYTLIWQTKMKLKAKKLLKGKRSGQYIT